jgi:CRP-like cAMP-binding protein
MDVATLEGLDLFAGLSAQQRERICDSAVEVEVPAGTELVRDAAVAWDFYVIVEGSAEARHADRKLGTLGPGDFFGEIGVMASDRRRTATVVTTAPTRAIRLSVRQVREIADEVPEFAERLRATIAEREQHLL